MKLKMITQVIKLWNWSLCILTLQSVVKSWWTILLFSDRTITLIFLAWMIKSSTRRWIGDLEFNMIENHCAMCIILPTELFLSFVPFQWGGWFCISWCFLLYIWPRCTRPISKLQSREDGCQSFKIISFFSLISGMTIGKLQEITKNWIEDRFKLSAKFLTFTSRNDWNKPIIQTQN